MVTFLTHPPLMHRSRRTTSLETHTTPISRIAIVGTVPSSFPQALLAPGVKPSDVSLSKAISQHLAYTYAIATTPSISSLYQCPAVSSCPDSVFVEDPVVMLSAKTAFMGTPGHPTRVGESANLAAVLRRIGIVVQTADVRIDGGDVLRVPGAIFVGMSSRTDADAVPALQQAVDGEWSMSGLPGPRVIPIPLEKALHLKSVVTWVGGSQQGDCGFLVAPDSELGRRVVTSMAEALGACLPVEWIEAVESEDANVLYIGEDEGKRGKVLVQGRCDGTAEAVEQGLLKARLHVDVARVDTSELQKANGALTCMSIIM